MKYVIPVNDIKKKYSINQMLVTILVIYCILFPADKINIKEILLLLTLFFYYISSRENLKVPKFIFSYSIVLPAILTIYAIIRGVGIGDTLSYGYVWIFLLLLPEIKKYNIDIKTPFFIATYIVALVIDCIMLLDLFGISSIYSNPIALFLVNMKELQGLGKGILATFGYSIFYKSCPLILITYGYLIYKKRYLLSIPLLLSLFACGTRANFLMALFITATIPILCTEKPSKKMIILLVIFTITLYLSPSVIDYMSNLNEIKYNRSEAIKLADMKNIFYILQSKLINILFGTGVGSSFYSVRGSDMTVFELSFIDYLRQVGIVGSVIFIWFIIRPLQRLYQQERWLFICYISYLGVAFTNPLLVNSTAFILYLLVYSVAFFDLT